MLRSAYERASAHIFPTHSVLSGSLTFTNLVGENWYLILIYIFPDTNEVDCSLKFLFWNNYRPTGSCKKIAQKCPCTTPLPNPDSPKGYILCNCSTMCELYFHTLKKICLYCELPVYIFWPFICWVIHLLVWFVEVSYLLNRLFAPTFFPVCHFWLLIFYCCITNYYKSSNLKQHPFIISRFPWAKSPDPAYLPPLLSFISLKSRCQPGPQFCRRLGILFQAHWLFTQLSSLQL